MTRGPDCCRARSVLLVLLLVVLWAQYAVAIEQCTNSNRTFDRTVPTAMFDYNVSQQLVQNSGAALAVCVHSAQNVSMRGWVLPWRIAIDAVAAAQEFWRANRSGDATYTLQFEAGDIFSEFNTAELEFTRVTMSPAQVRRADGAVSLLVYGADSCYQPTPGSGGNIPGCRANAAASSTSVLEDEEEKTEFPVVVAIIFFAIILAALLACFFLIVRCFCDEAKQAKESEQQQNEAASTNGRLGVSSRARSDAMSTGGAAIVVTAPSGSTQGGGAAAPPRAVKRTNLDGLFKPLEFGGGDFEDSEEQIHFSNMRTVESEEMYSRELAARDHDVMPGDGYRIDTSSGDAVGTAEVAETSPPVRLDLADGLHTPPSAPLPARAASGESGSGNQLHSPDQPVHVAM